MNKWKNFEIELDYIKNSCYRDSARKLLELVPDYFFTVSASSSGRYHPDFALGDGGLLRHTKVAIRIGYELLSLEYMNSLFDDREKDLLLIGIMFHDVMKLGFPKEKHTRFDHPLLAAKFIRDNQNVTDFTIEDVKFLEKIISSHMGQWNTNRFSDIILPSPSDISEFFVHSCDYLASRKFLNVNFDENNNIVSEVPYVKK